MGGTLLENKTIDFDVIFLVLVLDKLLWGLFLESDFHPGIMSIGKAGCLR